MGSRRGRQHCLQLFFPWPQVHLGTKQGPSDTLFPQSGYYGPVLVGFVHDLCWSKLSIPCRIALLLLQLGYVWHLFSSDADLANAAANVGSHFIINNLLQFAFVLLWVHSRFWIAEAVLILNFFNLTSLYLRYSTTPRFVHIPVVSGPLAWTFVAILWNGAAMVGAHSVPARILANIVIWAILVFGLLFLVAFKDYTMGFALSILAAGTLVPYSSFVSLLTRSNQPLPSTSWVSK
jgi:hypothetical protein